MYNIFNEEERLPTAKSTRENKDTAKEIPRQRGQQSQYPQQEDLHQTLKNFDLSSVGRFHESTPKPKEQKPKNRDDENDALAMFFREQQKPS